MSEQSMTWHMPKARIFVEVVSAGSITAAARSLRLSKSVVSAHLKELEEVCGARLIERTTRSQKLTEIGERFLPHAQAMITAWEAGLQEVQAAMDEPRGTLRVTASLLLERSLVCPAVTAYTLRYPSVSVEIDLSDGIHRLVEEQFDVALRVGSLADSNLRATKLGADRDIVIAGRDVAAELSACQRPEQLVEHAWITHVSLPERRRFVGPSGETIAIELRPRVRVNSSTAMMSLVAQAGLAIVPASLARPLLEVGELVHLLPDWHAGTVPIYALCPSGIFLPPKVSRFISIVRELVRP